LRQRGEAHDVARTIDAPMERSNPPREHDRSEECDGEKASLIQNELPLFT
jgi:hypothetical protein